MPSARALRVASLLTEPPYGCLGPSGNDRYRKRSLRSQTVGGFASQLPSRGGSFAMNGPPADVFGQALLEDPPQMARTACCRKSPRVPRVSWLGSWALGTSDRGGQDKANWRSRTRRRSAIGKPLSAHWFLAARRLALKRRLGEGGWRCSNFSNNLYPPRDGVRGVRFEGLHILFRSRARDCDFKRSTRRGSCAWRKR